MRITCCLRGSKKELVGQGVVEFLMEQSLLMERDCVIGNWNCQAERKDDLNNDLRPEVGILTKLINL